MKLLLVTATAIAVFTVDCRDFSSDPEGRGTDSEVQIFQEDIEEQGKRQTHPDGPHGSNLDENQTSDYNDQQMKEEKREQHQSQLGSTCETKLDQIEVTINKIYSILVPEATTSLAPLTTTAPATTPPATTSPVPPTTTAPATTTPVTTSPVPLTTTAPATTPPAVCSEASGFFKVPNSGNHCYKFFTDSGRSWQASKAKCQDEGLVLAKPVDPVALRKYLVQTFGNRMVWVGGQGTGSSRGSGSVEWIRDGSTLSSSSSAWYPGEPGSKTSTSYCLAITAHQSDMDSYPTQPYGMTSCTYSGYYALCEVAM